MIDFFRGVAFVTGVMAIVAGSVMYVLARLFGANGIMDRYRRDRGTEAVSAGLAIIGVGSIAWAIFW